ncbi:hypothetical protein K439DRAFT_1619681 [Ramaria rubella]|nr:hypothetical protein K439DRAFT_1619681 [Ramaria rubella]
MAGLHQVLGWVLLCDPVLLDLHPSLGNSDHTAQLINKLQYQRYPHRTGFEGAYHLLTEHHELPPDDQYIRCVEKHDIPGEEFEIEAWFLEYLHLIVVARVFTTSQLAATHLILFTRIFAIVEQDTGQIVHFRHIHGEGFETVVVDGHHGQAWVWDLTVKKYALHALMPYEHLARFYRYCFAHFSRNVTGLRIAPEIHNAMMSLALAKPLPDLEGTLRLIRTGGKKAADWLKDKEAASGFSLAAIY